MTDTPIEVKLSEPIAPALSPEAWEWLRTHPFEALEWPVVGTRTGMIAALNFYLPDGHPQKITRARIVAMREALEGYEDRSGWSAVECEPLAEHLRVLESYLPPEPPLST